MLLISCKKHDYRIIGLPAVTPLTIVKEEVISEDCINGILVLDTILLTLNECGINVFSVYDSENLERILNFGETGDKPSEFSSPHFYNDLNSCNFPLKICDMNRLQEKEIDLDAILQGENVYKSIKDINLPVEVIWARNMARFGNAIAGSDLDAMKESGPVFIYDTDTKKKTYIKYSPSYSFKRRQTLPIAYYNHIFVNAEKQTIGVAFRHLDMVNFYDLNGKLKRSAAFSKIRRPLESRDMAGIDYSYPVFHSGAFGCEDYFFAIRLNSSIEDWQRGKRINVEILKFDWEGNLLAVYSAPEPVLNVTCNRTGDSFYATIETDDPEYAKILKMQ